jgi:hypothetical protein
VADKKKTVAVELTAPGGKLDRDMRRNVGIVRKRSSEAQREANRVAAGTTGRRRGRGAPGMAAALGGARGRAGGVLKGAVAFGGFYGLQGELRNVMQFEETLVDIAVQGKKTKAWLSSFRREIVAQSDATGIAKEGFAGYVKQFAKLTGDVPAAVQSMKLAAKVSKAAKVDMLDMASLMVTLQTKAKIAGKDLPEAFDAIADQAEKGAVELEDMAGKFPMVLNTMQMFRHTGVNALKEYGAVFQIARRGNVSVDRTATSFTRLFSNIASKQGVIEKALGIKLQKDGAWIQLNEMLPLIFDKLVAVEKAGGKIRVGRKKMGVTGALNMLFGEEGVRAATPLMAMARNRWQSVGSESGFAELTAGGRGAIDRMLKTRKALSPTQSFNKELNRLRNQMHKHLLPALKLLGEMMPGLGKGLTFVLNNWKLLLSIWTSHKLMMFFANMAKAGREARGAGAGGFGGGGTYVGEGTRRRRGGRISRAIGGLGAAGGVVAAGAEGFMVGMALTNAAGEFTDAMSGWSQALSSDEKWRKEVAAEARARSMFRQSGSGHKVFTKLRTRYAGTEEGRQAIAAGAGASQELTAAIQSGDQERIKKALTRAQAPLQALSSARKEMVEGQDLTPLQRQARRGLFGRMTGAQRQDAFPQLEELILLQRAGLQEMKNFRKLDRLTAEIAAAGKASVDAAIQASRSGKQ